MGVLDWLYGNNDGKKPTAEQLKTGSVEKAAGQLTEHKKRMKRAECARQQKEFDPVTGKCI